MPHLIQHIGDALLMAIGMFWKTAWSLVLGFGISAVLQTVVPAEALRAKFGKGGPKEITLAAALGAASSSCSYAAASVMRTLFKRGASLTTALAFLFAATNLVLELGVIILLLMGWQFTAAEWIGGVVLIAVMSVIVALTYPKKLAEEARHHPEPGNSGHHHHAAADDGKTWRRRLAEPETRVKVAQAFTMEWGMLWKDLAIGFLVGGFIAVFVPVSVWQGLFLTDAPGWLRVPANAVIGPLIAMVTFVCSIGNVPLAAVLWGGGATFGGVIAFLYGDLIVLPLLDVYRRYFGWKMAAYIGLVLFAAMAIAAILIDLAFSGLGIVPPHVTDIRHQLTHFAIDYTFWLNLVFGGIGLWLWRLSKTKPVMAESHCCHH